MYRFVFWKGKGSVGHPRYAQNYGHLLLTHELRAIKEYIADNDCKVVLLSATSYNKSFQDLANQLGLFIPEDTNLWLYGGVSGFHHQLRDQVPDGAGGSGEE